jgi:hypothetical protein
MDAYFTAPFKPVEKHRKSNKIFLLLELSFIPFALWWIPYRHLPAPGWAVAFVAGAAAFMSVHDAMKGWQKAIWMVLIGAFLLTELRAINKDRAESQHQAAEDRKNQDIAFATVLRGQNEEFNSMVRGFTDTYIKVDGVLKTTSSVARIAKSNLDALTGQGSVPCAIPKPDPVYSSVMPLNIVNIGQNNLTDVEMTINAPEDSAVFSLHSSLAFSAPISIGTLKPFTPKAIFNRISLVHVGRKPVEYRIDIWTQNGHYIEDLWIRSTFVIEDYAFKYTMAKEVEKVPIVIPRSIKPEPMETTRVSKCELATWSDGLP